METKKTFRGTITLVITAIATLLLLVPQAIFVRQTYAKYTENILNYENKQFSDVTEMGKLHIIDCFATLIERANSAGKALSVIGTDVESVDKYFLSPTSANDADAILIYKSDRTLAFGETENCPLFLETARAAESSRVTVTSDFVACADGSMRIGIAAPFKAEDGSIQAVVMLYSQASLENMLDSPPLDDNGRFGIIDENGSMVLGQSSGEAWFKNGLFSFGESGALKEKLLTIARTTDGAKFTAYMKALGFNNWMVIYIQPTKEMNLDMNGALLIANLFSAVAVLLILCLIAFCVLNTNRNSRRMELFRMKFRIATKQSARAAFEYDRRTDKLVFISESEHVKLPKPYVSLMELGTYVHPADRPTYYQSVSDLRTIGATSVIVRIFNFCGRDVYRWYRVTGTRLTDRGEGKALTIGTVEDIDEQENERLILREKATTDSLTGLRNRAETEKAVNACLSRLEENEQAVFALLDLDDFKDINDKYGHDCGDRALIHFADKLRTTFRFGDIIGRLGGDEFVVYMTLTSDRKIVERRLRELLDGLVKDSLSADKDIPATTCSIGCCITSKVDTFETVYKRADNAMYKAKNNGKGQFVIDD